MCVGSCEGVVRLRRRVAHRSAFLSFLYRTVQSCSGRNSWEGAEGPARLARAGFCIGVAVSVLRAVGVCLVALGELPGDGSEVAADVACDPFGVRPVAGPVAVAVLDLVHDSGRALEVGLLGSEFRDGEFVELHVSGPFSGVPAGVLPGRAGLLWVISSGAFAWWPGRLAAPGLRSTRRPCR